MQAPTHAQRTFLIFQIVYGRSQHRRLVHFPVGRRQHAIQFVYQAVELIPAFLFA